MKQNQNQTRPAGFDVNRVLAKSDGKGLLTHLEECLEVYQALCQALPTIPAIAKEEDFFDLLFFAVYLHDWGKTHAEFQKLLKGKTSQWLQSRHEIYSVPFVEMLPLSPGHKELISLSILGHHKDFETIQDYLYSKQQIEDYGNNLRGAINPHDFQANLKHCLDVPYLVELKKRLQNYYDKYASGKRFFELTSIDFSSQENPILKYAKPLLKKSTGPGEKSFWQQMLLWGCIKQCDHMGSAGINDLPRLSHDCFKFLDKLKGKWFAHQQYCGRHEGNLFLIAPTGSGKTEAALKWIKKQLSIGHQGRIFYILPYTASINAMHQRLIRDFEGGEIKPGGTKYIGVLHGKITQYLAKYFDEKSDDPEESRSWLRKMREIHRQMVHPLKVVTPFQILKYCYGVKGFEMGFAELAGAMLIFDEIHAYDSQTFAQIVSSLKWLCEHLQIRVLVMTATLPSFMLGELQEALGNFDVVRAEEKLLEKFTRHRIRIKEGNIFNQVADIEASLLKGERTIVVCNTVANAQRIFLQLQDMVDQEKAVLLHSRFIAEHRLEKEKALIDNDILLLVGTQAIEVSLDIDFDIMFTEPAPLDALIQRFGRINRRRNKGICSVNVCLEGGEFDHYIYPRETIKRTLVVLERVTTIREKDLQEMLDEVYPDWPEKRKYMETREGFSASLNRLRPFRRFREEEESFYDRFTGIPVLPITYQEEYEEHISRLDFFKAESFNITIHLGMFHKLLKSEKIERIVAVINKKDKLKPFPYWLVKCKYDPQLGLLEDDEMPSPGKITLMF